VEIQNLLLFASGSFAAAVGGARLATAGISLLNVALIAVGLFLAFLFVDSNWRAVVKRYRKGKKMIKNNRAARGLAIAIIGILAIVLMVGLAAANLVPAWPVAVVGGLVVLAWLANDVPGCYNRSKSFERRSLGS